MTTTAYKYMPKDALSKRVLLERAELDATDELDTQDRKDAMPYIRFTLGGEEVYGILFSASKAVISGAKFSRPPCSPNIVTGVINFRGSLISVIDLASMLAIDAPPKTESSLIIVSDSKGKMFALNVSAIQGSDKYFLNDDAFDSSIVFKKSNLSNYILGIHKGLVAVLDVNALVSNINVK